MAYPVEEIEGIGPSKRDKLNAAGVQTTEDLLDHAGSAKGRETLATATGIPKSDLLSYVNYADLMRLRGVGQEYSELLEKAGVDTVKELAHRVPANLHAKLEATAEAHPRLVRRTPSAGDVATWITEAKTLEPRVTH